MQGRLSPPHDGKIQSFPKESWEREFFLANDLGLSHIEWVFDVASCHDNPLLTDEGLEKIFSLQQTTQVKVIAICADYFRDFPIIRIDPSTLNERIDLLCRLARSCETLGTGYIMIPFVDHSAIQGENEFNEAVTALRNCLSAIEQYGIQISLETNLKPVFYRKLLEDVNHPGLKVNYDVGDCTSLGHNVEEEIGLLADWMVGFHIKDRKVQGGTVPLGTGDVCFPKCLKTLCSIGYKGPLTLQVAREGDEVEQARKNAKWIKSLQEEL